MPKRFLTPGTMSQEELSEYVQPSWGTILGKSIGQGVSGLAGTFDRRMEQSRRDALALQKQRALYERQRSLAGYKHELGEPERKLKRDAAERAEKRHVSSLGLREAAGKRAKKSSEQITTQRAEALKEKQRKERLKKAGQLLKSLASPSMLKMMTKGVKGDDLFTEQTLVSEALAHIEETERMEKEEADYSDIAGASKRFTKFVTDRFKSEEEARIEGETAKQKRRLEYGRSMLGAKEKAAAERADRTREEDRQKGEDKANIALHTAAVKKAADGKLKSLNFFKSTVDLPRTKEGTMALDMFGGGIIARTISDLDYKVIYGTDPSNAHLKKMINNARTIGSPSGTGKVLDYSMMMQAPGPGWAKTASDIRKLLGTLERSTKYRPGVEVKTLGDALDFAGIVWLQSWNHPFDTTQNAAGQTVPYLINSDTSLSNWKHTFRDK